MKACLAGQQILLLLMIMQEVDPQASRTIMMTQDDNINSSNLEISQARRRWACKGLNNLYPVEIISRRVTPTNPQISDLKAHKKICSLLADLHSVMPPYPPWVQK